MSRAYILDRNTLATVGLVDQSYTKLTYTRRFWATDTFTLEINRKRLYASEIQKGRLLYLPDEGDRVFLVEQIEMVQSGERAKDMMTVSGRSLEGLALVERICVPPVGLAYDALTGSPAETAIKHYVTANAVSAVDTNRNIAGLTVAPNAASGLAVDVAARFQTVLDFIANIGVLAGIGWEIVLDPVNSVFVFDTVTGVDRSASVFFDFEFETLEQWEEVDSALNSKTVAFVAGQGEGVNRDLVIRGAATGWDRREAFIDARDVELGDTTILNTRGDSFLATSTIEQSVEATIHQFGSFRYRTHWDLGDIILVRNQERGLQYSARIVQVDVTISESPAAPVIVATLGKPMPTIQNQGSPGSSSPTADNFATITGIPAGGVLSGTYPNPGFSVAVAAQQHNRAHDHSDALDGKIRPVGYTTTGTGASFAGQWTRIAFGQLATQYHDHRFKLLVTNNGGGTAASTRGILDVAVKQQVALGGQPSVLVEWDGASAEADDWAVVVTSTSAVTGTSYGLYHRIDSTYDQTIFVPFTDTTVVGLDFLEAEGFSASLPGGTAYGGVWRSPTFDTAWFGGTAGAAGDVNLYRGAADQLKTDDHFYTRGSLTVGDSTTDGNGVLLVKGNADPDYIALIYNGSAGGVLQLGSGAAGERDVNLYRSAANTLKTDDSLVVLGNAYFNADDGGNTQDGIALLGGNIEMRNGNPFIDFKTTSIDFGARIIYDYNIADGLEFTGAAGGYKFDAPVSIGSGKLSRFVPVIPFQDLIAAATYTADDTAAQTVEVTGVPATGVVAVQATILCRSSVANTSNAVQILPYGGSTASDYAFVCYNGAVATYYGNNTGRVATGGTNSRQIKYWRSWGAGTITWYMRISGYWTTE